MIPPELAYGTSGGHRLSGRTLVFVIDLIDALSGSAWFATGLDAGARIVLRHAEISPEWVTLATVSALVRSVDTPASTFSSLLRSHQAQTAAARRGR